MAKTDEKVMAVVEQELKKNPDASVDELMEKAKSVNSAIGKLTARQFNARYPLQVKRRMKAKAKPAGTAKKRKRSTRKRAAPSGDGGGREKVRETLLRFAGDLVAAEERKDLVKVLSNVDRYVDEVLKASS